MCNSTGIPESFFSSSQFPLRPFLLKETWLLTLPSCTPWNIWKNTSNISLHPLLFPCSVSRRVGAREAARGRQHGRLVLTGDLLQPRSALPAASGGLRLPTETPTHLHRIVHVFFICNNTAAVFDMKREHSVWGTGTVKRTLFPLGTLGFVISLPSRNTVV